MGRKGRGQKGFMKAVLKNTTEEMSLESNPSDVVEEQHQQIPKNNEDDLPNASETEQACAIPSVEQEASAATRDPESKSQMQKRHQRELKALKRLSTKGGKRKEVANQLEEMRSRHAAELRELDSMRAEETSTVPGEVGFLSRQQDHDGINNGQVYDEPALNEAIEHMEGAKTASEEDRKMNKQNHLTRAQRRRQKVAAKETERNARIAKELSEIGESARAVEERQLKARLAPLGLQIHEIKPDGHCMYRALEDQLSRCSHVKGFQELRGLAAEYILSHKAEFYPFMVQEEPALGPEEALEAHCERIKSTTQWGGEMELNALSRALKMRVIVHSAEMPDQIIGEELNKETQTLRVCFMRHAYKLGDHYNSVVKIFGFDHLEDQQNSWDSS